MSDQTKKTKPEDDPAPKAADQVKESAESPDAEEEQSSCHPATKKPNPSHHSLFKLGNWKGAFSKSKEF